MHIRSLFKALALVLTLGLVAAACGGSDDEGTTTSSTGSTTTTPEAESETETDEDAETDDTDAEADADLAGTKLIVYSGRGESLVQPLIDNFEAATGVEVQVRYGNSAELGAALMEEGDRTPAEVFYSQEVGALGMLAKADLLAPLPDDVVTLVDARYQPGAGNQWVGVTGRSRVIVYNPDLVPELPTTVLELTDPKYRGMTAWVPSNAGFQAFMTAFRVSVGEDAARQWLTDMVANDVQTYTGNGAVLEAVNNGEVPMGLINHYYWGGMVTELGGVDNVTARLIFPEGDDPGALVNATAVGILNNGSDNPAALAFVKYLLSVEGQTHFVEETYEYPLIEGVDDPAGFPALDDLQGPDLDLTDLDSLEATQEMLTEAGLL